MASKKELKALITLAGRVDPSLQASLLRTTRESNRMSQSVRRTASGMASFGKLVKKAALGVGAYMSVNAIKNYGNESVEAAKKQIDAETKLEAVLKNVRSLQEEGPRAYKKAKFELLGVASQLQKIGVIGDEVTLAGFQQLAGYQMSQKEIGVLSGGMADLLAKSKGLSATQEDAVTIATQIGKAYNGQVGGLEKIGVQFSKAQKLALKTGSATERAAIVAEALKHSVGGVNQALAKTDQGKIQKMTMAYGDMKEEVGKKILPLQAKFANWFFKNMPQIQEVLLKTVDKATYGAEKLGENVLKLIPYISKASKFAVEGYDKISKSIDWVRQNSDWLIPSIAGLSAAFVGLKVITFLNDSLKAYRLAMAGAQTINAFTSGSILGLNAALLAQKLATIHATFATGGFNAVLAANPIGATVIGIGLLVAAGIALWKNWDKIKEKAAELWGSVSKYLGPIGKLLGSGNDSSNLQAKGSSNYRLYANGGIANQPSIFGEAGPEMAIPLKKEPRSFGLLSQTARMLGAPLNQATSNMIINIKVDSHGGTIQAAQQTADVIKETIVDVMENYFHDRRRVEFSFD